MHQQPRTLQLVIMIVFLIALAGFVTELLVTDVRPENGDEAAEEPGTPYDDGDERTPPDGYVLLRSAETNVSLFIPEGASTSTPTEDRLSVKYLGPNNEPGTEIQDGFTFTIHRDVGTTATSLAAYGETLVTELEDLELAVTEPLEETTLGGSEALTFAHESALGTMVTEYALLSGSGVGYTVSYTINGDDVNEYREMIRTMLESFRVTTVSL